MRSMDPSHVAMAELVLSADGFTEFSAPAENLTADIPLRDILKFLKRVSDDEMLLMIINDNEKTITMILKNEDVERAFMIRQRLTDDGTNIEKAINIKFDAQIHLSSIYLSNALDDAGSLADAADFEISKNGLMISAEGELGSAVTELRAAGIAAELPEGVSSVKATYSLDYLRDFARSKAAAAFVTVKMSQEKPVLFGFDLANDLGKWGHIAFLLAPRAED